MQETETILRPVIRAVQQKLVEAMQSSGVSMAQAAPVLGYENKSSVSRALVKFRMSISDIVKIMALTKTRTLLVPGLRLELNVTSVNQVDALLDALRTSIMVPSQNRSYRQLLNKMTWEELAGASGYNNKVMIWKTWMHLQTPLHVVISVIRHMGLSPHRVEVGYTALTVELKQQLGQDS